MADTFVMASPLGPLELRGTSEGLQSVRYRASAKLGRTLPASLARIVRQLQEYFAGKRTGFDLTLDPQTGTEFELKIWQALAKTKFGSVTTYSDLAKAAGKPKAIRAVGSAMRKNPLPIIVPCHRVLPSWSKGNRAKPGNYNGGPQKKLWLLEHEVK